MTDFLEDKQAEIAARMKELKPLVDEHTRLEAAVQALDGIPAAAAPPDGRRRPGRPPGSKNTTAATAVAASPTTSQRDTAKPAGAKRARKRGGGRRKGTGKRAVEALQVIEAKPGITIPEIATKMGIKQNYLYRVLPSLKKEGNVAQKGRAWHPAATATT